jgi:CMP-N,N'-diacetyllegionaminic acid synthase
MPNMKSSPKTLCTICGRKGSKGVKNKNTRQMLGKPLFLYTLEAAIKSKIFDTIVLSSDDEVILEMGNRMGVYTIHREAELCSDEAGKVSVIRHALSTVEVSLATQFDLIFDLDITSPLRSAQDIKEAHQILRDGDAGNIVSVCESSRSPYFNMVERGANGKFELCKKSNGVFLSRQKTPEVYELNASIYGWKRDILLNRAFNTPILDHTYYYKMPRHRSIDIDDELDWKIVEFLLKE